MESSSSKRRMLISISSHVLSWPDVPARFESLNDDTKRLILKFLGNKSYATYGGINKHCKEIYLTTPGMTKQTFLYGYAPLKVIQVRIKRASSDIIAVSERVGKGVVLYNRRDVLAWLIQERNIGLLKGICNVAAEEGRIDILNEVLINVEDGHGYTAIHRDVDRSAARGGKVNVLKWLETKGLFISEYMCAAQAAIHGHLHIIQWLQEEKGLELDEVLYIHAINGGGHLHVMKWLREQEVDWDEYTFPYAACRGNLDVLQWLHDEGCPWPEDVWYRVREEDLKPEALAWLRSNGYRNIL